MCCVWSEFSEYSEYSELADTAAVSLPRSRLLTVFPFIRLRSSSYASPFSVPQYTWHCVLKPASIKALRMASTCS